MRDLAGAVEVVHRVMAGYSAEYMAALRGDPIRPVLRPLAHPLADELAAIDEHIAALTPRYTEIPAPVTLMLGELNEEKPPYGVAFNSSVRPFPIPKSFV